MKRAKMSRQLSRKVFRAAGGTHPRNLAQAPMRGGWRL